MTPRKPLQVGDRVAVYPDGIRCTGKVTCTCEYSVVVSYDRKTISNTKKFGGFFDPKNCFRLSPKPKRKPREFWIVKHPANDGPYAYDTFESAECGAGYYQPGREIIHVREVLK